MGLDSGIMQFPSIRLLPAIWLVILSALPTVSVQANQGVYKSRITPHWSEDGNHFWYRNDLADGQKEYILVDAVKGKRQPAFDHCRLAQALEAAGVKNVDAGKLQLTGLAFDLEARKVTFRTKGKDWSYGLKANSLEPASKRNVKPKADGFRLHPADVPKRSLGGGDDTHLHFVNRTDGEVELIWITTGGGRRSYGKLAAGAEKNQHTYSKHAWLVLDAKGKPLVAFVAEKAGRSAVITGQEIPRKEKPKESPKKTTAQRVDPAWHSSTRDYNIFLRPKKGENREEVQLSKDGAENNRYEMLRWAPDGQTLIAFRVTPGERKEVYRIESSPKGGGRAKLQQNPYPLPGDKFTSYELNLFHVAEGKQTKPKVERVDFGRPNIRFSPDGQKFTYEKIDRGHQRFRLIEVDIATGKVRNLIDEKTETFIWTAHLANFGMRMVNWLEKGTEALYLSERDGWRHLYFLDAEAGGIQHQITKGEFVVRGIDKIDESKRQIWFRASGRNPGQDPYLIHYYRVNFDGTGFTALTEGNGNHSITYSPDRRFLIDTYSRVDQAPIHELRRVCDGQLVCELERADTSEAEGSGWRPDEVFTAKGRDGKTDIWGIICRPQDFDPKKKYPVIEDIYAGPHGSFVPKTFSPGNRYRQLAELGFIVVKIDGMGTANRSKAFHDVCWHNLKDSGFPDRILWMQAAAKKYPYMDLGRVGIYGTSAGGQIAAAALLFHGDFYKAAYAACGCHDNRMDKASWNEQWMGYPVGPHYAENSNIDNAHRLRGKLMLMVGALDRNVPPESTLRFANALIKAGKDFDMLYMPRVGHSNGGGYGHRRMRDFFVRHLQGIKPPDRNQQ